MLGNILPPYHSLQELNLDWILTKVKNILRFVPDDGAVGQILRRTAYGAEWSDEQGAGGSVTSVNGQQGAVVLDAADVGALPDTTVIPDSTSDLINDSGFVNAAGAAAAAPVQSVNGQTGDVVISGGGAVDSVNGQTGTVVLDASDVGALPDSYVAPVTSVNGQTGAVSLSIPDSTGDLINDSGFVDAASAAAAAPVQSVNGQTGAVVLQGDIDFMTFTAPSTSFAGNAATDANFTITRAGYTPLCAIPVRTFSSNLVFVGCRIENINTAVLTVRNLVSSTVTAAPVVGVLFVKNT